MLLIGAPGGLVLVGVGWVSCEAIRCQNVRGLIRERDGYIEGRIAVRRAQAHLEAKQAEAQGTINTYKRLGALHHANNAGVPVEEWWAMQERVGQ